VHFHVRPAGDFRFQSERPLALGLGSQCMQGVTKFLHVDATRDAHGTDVMAVQAVGEPPQHGLTRISYQDQL
jgi:hypothetical protein